MSDEIKDAREVSPELSMAKRTTPAFGPGHVNLAVPDRGHIPSCVPMEFDNATELEKFCAEHQDWLTVMVTTRADKVFAIFQVLKSEVEQHEMRIVGQVVEQELEKLRAKRKEEEANVAKFEAEKAEADDECRKIGRLCIEKHEPFVRDLPGLSKIKNVRKSIADDILKVFQEALAGLNFTDKKAGIDGWSERLNKVLAKYVKEGA